MPGLSYDCCVETGEVKSGTQTWWTPVVDPGFDWDCFIDAGGDVGDGAGYVEMWFRPKPAARELKPGKGAEGDVAGLQAKLGEGVLEFEKDEWAEFGITGLYIDHYVLANDGFFCVPDRAQPTPWARERSHVFKKVFFNAWRVLVVQTAVETKLELDEKRQKAAELQMVKLKVRAMMGNQEKPVMSDMQAIISELDDISTPLLQERVLHDLSEMDVPSGTKDHSMLMAMLKPLKFVSKWAKTYGDWLDKEVDVYEEWCAENEEDGPRDDTATITARSVDSEEDNDDDDEDSHADQKKDKKGAPKIKKPTPKSVEKVLESLEEAAESINTIKKLGEQAMEPKTLEDLATDALQTGGGAGLRRYNALQRVLVRKKKFLGGYRWVEGQVKSAGDTSGKHKMKVNGWSTSVSLHPWNHAPLELPMFVFTEKLKAYEERMRKRHLTYNDPVMGRALPLDVLEAEEEEEDVNEAPEGTKAAAIRLEVVMTEDEKTAKQKDEDAAKKDEENRLDKEQKEAAKLEKMEEAAKRKKMKARKRMGEAKLKAKMAKDDEEKLKRMAREQQKKLKADIKKKKREEYAKKRAMRKMKPISEMTDVVNSDTLAQWLNTQHVQRLNGKAVSMVMWTDEGTKTFRQVAKETRAAEDAVAYKMLTLGTLSSEPPTAEAEKKLKSFAKNYEAAHATSDAAAFLSLWALESGLRWHSPFGQPSIDGMDRIRASALKSMPEIESLEVEGIFYAKDLEDENNGSTCKHAALLCTVKLVDDEINHKVGATFKRLDVCAFTSSYGLKEVASFVEKPPETEKRFAQMEAQLGRFTKQYAKALEAANQGDGGKSWLKLWSDATELKSVERNGKKFLEKFSNNRWFSPYGTKPMAGPDEIAGGAREISCFRDVTAEQVYYGAVPTHAVLHYARKTSGVGGGEVDEEGKGAIGPDAIALVEEAEPVAFLNIYTFEEPEAEVVEEKKTAGRKNEQVEVKAPPKKLKGAEDPGYWGFSETRIDMEALKKAAEAEAESTKSKNDEGPRKVTGRAGACILLTAEPAGGKTILCSQLVIRTLDMVKYGKSDLVPILLKGQKLHTWLKDEKHAAKFGHAWNWVDAYLQIEYEGEPEMYLMLRQALMARRGLVLIDGLDEGGDERERIETQILEVLAPQGHVLFVTSRPDPSIQERFSGFHQLQLMPLSPEEQGRYVMHRIGDDEGGQMDFDKFELQRYLGRVVPNEPGTQTRITANPLLLSMVISLFMHPSPEAEPADGGGGAVSGLIESKAADDDEDDAFLQGGGRLPDTITEVYAAALDKMIENADFPQLDAEGTPISQLSPEEHAKVVKTMKELICGIFFQAHCAETRVIDSATFDKASFELMKDKLKIDAQVQDKYDTILKDREAHRTQLMGDYASQLDLLKNERQYDLDLAKVNEEINDATERMAAAAEETEAWVQHVMDAVEILSRAVVEERVPILSLVASDPEDVQIQSAHLTFQEFFCAKAICDGQRVPTPPWKWSKWFKHMLDFGAEMGTAFHKGLFLAARVSTAHAKKEMEDEDGVYEDRVVLKEDDDHKPNLNLNLSKDKIGGDRETSIAAVGHMLRVATTAYLVDNDLSGDEMELLFPRDDKRATCPMLKYLDLHRNNIGVPDVNSGLVLGMERLSEALRVGRLSGLAGLDLHGNSIGKEGTRLLSSALSKGKCPELKVIVLDKFEIFDQEVTSYDAYGRDLNDDDLNIIGMLVQNGAMPLCNEYNLLGNHFGHKEINEFVQILEKRESAKLPPGSVPKRDVRFTLVGDKIKGAHASFTGYELVNEDIELIAQTLAHGGPFEQLKELDFSHNPIEDDAVKWLAEKIGNNDILKRTWTLNPADPKTQTPWLQSVRGLNLSSTRVGHAGMEALFDAMKRGCLEELQLLSLMRNNITDDTIGQLIELGKKHKKLRYLKTLYIGRNKVSSAPLNELAKVLKDGEINNKTGERTWFHFPGLKEIYYTDRDKGAAGGYSEELETACAIRNITYKHKSERR